MKRRAFFFVAAVLLFAGCRPTRFFYYPNRVLYLDPEKMGIPYTLLEVPSLNGKKLSVLSFEAPGKPLGTVVHFHGNFANVSNHFTQSQFLTNYGFDVLIFDYQGYGGSEGTPTPLRTIEDGQAIVRYAQNNLRNPEGGVVIFGQSLGGAVGAVVAAKEPEVKGVVLEAAFSSYRSIARHALGSSFLLWPLYPVYPLFIPTKYDALRWVDKISPRPILFIHGDSDRIVPTKMSKVLFDAAKEPKTLWIVEGANHLQCRRKKGKEYEARLADFFKAAMAQK